MKRTSFYRYTTIKKNGVSQHVKKKMTSTEVKSYIMKAHGWTKEEYQKKYDIFKNKLRAEEAFEANQGRHVERQSPVALLFKQAKSMNLYGPNYKKSIKMQRIESFQSVSMGKKGREALKSQKYIEKYSKVYSSFTDSAFQNLIDRNKQAKEIYTKIKDPVKREQALTDFANKLHAKIDEQGKVAEDEAIPFSSETFGSDIEIDFDYDEYN